MLLACLVWGATPTIGRLLASYQAPFVVVCLRFIIALVFLLWFTAMARAFIAVPRRQWWRFVVCAASGIWLHNGLLYKGLESTTATTASIILALIAILVVLLDVVCYRRYPARVATAGVSLCFIGASFVITDGRLGELAALRIGPGEILVFLSALVWAIYSVVGRDLMTEYSPLVVTSYATALGVLMLSPALALEPALTQAILSDPLALGLMGFLGLFGSALGFLWYAQALARIGTVGTSAYMNLTPVFGVGTAMLVLGERASPAVLGGGLLVLGGLILVNWPRTARAA